MKTLKQFLVALALMMTVLVSVSGPVLIVNADPAPTPNATSTTNLLPLGDTGTTNPYASLPTTTGTTADQRF